MRIIIEQSLEWQTPSTHRLPEGIRDRDVIWSQMHQYVFPPKFVNIILQLYEYATFKVIQDGKLTDSFSRKNGARQGCLLSPTIFLKVVDWVMRQPTAGKKIGIQLTFTKQLEFADGISLLSHKQQDAQEKLYCVAEDAEKIGLKINIGKTEVMRVNSRQQELIQLNGENIKVVDKLVYLGSIVSKDGGTDEDIKSHVNQKKPDTRIQHLATYMGINRYLRNTKLPEVVSNESLWTRTRQVAEIRKGIDIFFVLYLVFSLETDLERK